MTDTQNAPDVWRITSRALECATKETFWSILLDGGSEACRDSDIRDFFFAVGAQLNLATLTNLFNKTDGPCNFIGISLQFISIGNVFKFGIKAVQEPSSRNFDTYEERDIFGTLSVFGLDSVINGEIFVITGINVGNFAVNTQILEEVIAGTPCKAVRDFSRMLNRIKYITAVSGADFRIAQLEGFFGAEIACIELIVVGTEQQAEAGNTLIETTAIASCW